MFLNVMELICRGEDLTFINAIDVKGFQDIGLPKVTNSRSFIYLDFAITGMLTAFWISLMSLGSDIRATPPLLEEITLA